MYSNSHNFELGEEISFDNQAFVQAFLNSKSYDLTPVYYQLSQAENDKISHATLIIREAEVWDVKAIVQLVQNVFKQDEASQIDSKLLSKSYITYVAQIDEQIVGFVIVEKQQTDSAENRRASPVQIKKRQNILPHRRTFCRTL